MCNFDGLGFNLELFVIVAVSDGSQLDDQVRLQQLIVSEVDTVPASSHVSHISVHLPQSLPQSRVELVLDAVLMPAPEVAGNRCPLIP